MQELLALAPESGYLFEAGVTATGQRHTDGTRPVVATEERPQMQDAATREPRFVTERSSNRPIS